MEKPQKIALSVAGAIAAVLVIVAAVLFFTRDSLVRRGNFEAPPLETNAVAGTPGDLDESLSYQQMAVKEDYVVYLCATPKAEGDRLTLYFTCAPENTDLMKIRVFDEAGELLGESGLLTPGTYLPEVALSRALASGEMISIQVMAYEPETYYSGGSIRLNVYVQ